MAAMLEQMENAKVFSIRKKGDKFIVDECCDGYFSEELTADELRRLGQEIIDLASS